MTDRVGQQLGNYRLTRLLGHGGFADVYLAEHMHLGTYAAIKVLQTQMENKYLEAFRAEARIIAHLEHPHIVRVLEFGIENAFPFLVMDYAPHGTLRHRHTQGTQLPLEFILPYVKQVAEALQYAHDAKLIHRDVKPENMLVGRNGTILLSDFGIAVAVHRTQSMSLQNDAGTVSYMAPEQIQGKARPASDQYSLGAVVYEWLSGKPPFEGTSVVEIAMKHLSDTPPSLRQTIPTISPSVEHIMRRVLAKDPQQRFPHVQGFAAALEETLREQRNPVLAPQPIMPSQITAPSTIKGMQLPLNLKDDSLFFTSPMTRKQSDTVPKEAAPSPIRAPSIDTPVQAPPKEATLPPIQARSKSSTENLDSSIFYNSMDGLLTIHGIVHFRVALAGGFLCIVGGITLGQFYAAIGGFLWFIGLIIGLYVNYVGIRAFLDSKKWRWIVIIASMAIINLIWTFIGTKDLVSFIFGGLIFFVLLESPLLFIGSFDWHSILNGS